MGQGVFSLSLPQAEALKILILDFHVLFSPKNSSVKCTKLYLVYGKFSFHLVSAKR